MAYVTFLVQPQEQPWCYGMSNAMGGAFKLYVRIRYCAYGEYVTRLAGAPTLALARNYFA